MLETNTVERKDFIYAPHPKEVGHQNARVKDAAVDDTQPTLEEPSMCPAQVSEEGGVSQLVKHDEAY